MTACLLATEDSGVDQRRQRGSVTACRRSNVCGERAGRCCRHAVAPSRARKLWRLAAATQAATQAAASGAASAHFITAAAAAAAAAGRPEAPAAPTKPAASQLLWMREAKKVMSEIAQKPLLAASESESAGAVRQG